MINLSAEESLIGAMLVAPELVLPETVLALSPEEFGCAEYRNAYTACRDLYNEGRPVDIVTVLGRLGDEYRTVLVRAVEATPTARNFRDYLELVKQSAQRTAAGEQTARLLEALETGEDIPTCRAIAVRACEALSDAAQDRTMSAKDGFVRFAVTKTQPRQYIRTGIARLDRAAYIDRGDYIIIGGRPSSGKTALTLQIALHMAREYQVVYFSLETSAEKIFDRLVCSFSQVDFGLIKKQEIPDEAWTRIAGDFTPFSRLRLHVVEAAGWTVAQIRAKAVQLGAQVIFVDYLSLIRSRGGSLYERVSNISTDLHTLAQQSRMAVIALSQLNREGKGEPDMTHLRESGQIEQDADVILLLHNTNPLDKCAPRELIVAKNKEGNVGKIPLCFEGSLQTFREMVRDVS